MFNVNDYVVYQYWVCQILDIKKLDYSNMGFDKDVTYYIMKSVYEKETFFIPITNGNSLREPISYDEAIQLIDSMPSLEPISKLNDEEYRSIIHNYNCESYAKIVKSIYAKNKYNTSIGKRLSIIDSKYFHLAEKYLYDELAFSLNITPNKVEEYISNRLNSNKIA